jgi:Sec-independent protein translocase protein TatA
MIGTTELIIIIVVAAIFFFGKDKVIEWAKSVGEAKHAYRQSAEGKHKKAKKK